MHEVVDLRNQPGHVAIVADRLWHAWWRDTGHSLSQVQALVRASLQPGTIPSCLVATGADGRFAGTASLIAHDMDARPHYTPWIAAVWVEPDARGTGLGSRLVTAAARIGFEAGIERIFLYTDRETGPFYEKMGWLRIEADVEGSDIFAMDAALFTRQSAATGG
jgi:GNAT superfamily N-acetyltransferase